MDITKWSKPKSNRLHFCSQRWKRCTQSAKTRPGADCVSDPQLLIARFRLKLKKTRKNTRPARYDFSQTPYDFAEEETSGLKGLDLVTSVVEGRRAELCNSVQKATSRTVPKEREARKQSACEEKSEEQRKARKRRVKSSGKRGREGKRHPEVAISFSSA